MNSFLIILAGIVLTAALAYVIVKFVPRKVLPLVSLALLAVAAFLAYQIWQSIQKPIKFNAEKTERYTEVISNLSLIRKAEVLHKKVTGTYESNPAKLINFIENGKIAITEARNEEYTKNIGGGLTVKAERRVVDTVGYSDVRAEFAGKDFKNMFKIPGTSKSFEIKVDSIEKDNGIVAPVFEVKVDKAIVLEGMDKDLIQIEKKAIASDQIRGDVISIGSLSEVNDNGNWPPSYDLAIEAKK